MDNVEQKRLQELQIALAFLVQRHRGNLYCQEVVTSSHDLDELIVKIMRQRRNT